MRQLWEAKEETGLDVTVLGPLDTFHFYRGSAREEAIVRRAFAALLARGGQAADRSAR